MQNGEVYSVMSITIMSLHINQVYFSQACQPGKKIKLGVREKEERKQEENYIKKGGKGLKNASFWPVANVFVMEKK